MYLLEQFKNLVEGNGRASSNSWGDIANPLLFDDDHAPDFTEGFGLFKADSRQWREADSQAEELYWGTIAAENDQQFDITATVYPGLSSSQYAQVKKQIEAVHRADLYLDSPFYVRLAYEITSTLQPESLVIVVSAQQGDNPAQPVGYLNVGPADSETGHRQIGILVLATFRRKGISRRMFMYVVEKSASLSMKSFWVQYDSRNKDVENFLFMIEKNFSDRVVVTHNRSVPQEWSAILEIK